MQDLTYMKKVESPYIAKQCISSSLENSEELIKGDIGMSLKIASSVLAIE